MKFHTQNSREFHTDHRFTAPSKLQNIIILYITYYMHIAITKNIITHATHTTRRYIKDSTRTMKIHENLAHRKIPPHLRQIRKYHNIYNIYEITYENSHEIRLSTPVHDESGTIPLTPRKWGKKAYRKRRKLSAAANSISAGNPGFRF